MVTPFYPSITGLSSGIIQPFAASAGDASADTRLSSTIVGPMVIDGVFYSLGLLAVQTFTPATNAGTFHVKLYDLGSGAQVAGLAIDPAIASTNAPSGAQALLMSGLCPLQRARNGFFSWFLEDASFPTTRINARLQQYITESGGNRRLVTGSGDFAIQARTVDACPWSQTTDIYVTLAHIQTAAGTAQLTTLHGTVDDTAWPVSPGTKTLLAFEEFWHQEYNLDAWTDRPDSAIAVQPTPNAVGLTPSIVALMGNWFDTSGICTAATNPRLLLTNMDGAGQFTSGEFGYGRAHSMVVNQLGDVFVAGTADVVNDGPFLICRYNVNRFGETQAVVQHLQGGLGEDWSDPGSTLVHGLMWSGSRLVAIDHGAARSRAFVYNRDLQLQTIINLSATASPAGSRFRGGRGAAAWLTGAY